MDREGPRPGFPKECHAAAFPSRVGIAFVVAFTAICVITRVWLFCSISAGSRSDAWSLHGPALLSYAGAFANDLLTLGVLLLLRAALRRFVARSAGRINSSMLRWCDLAMAALFLLCSAMIALLHVHLAGELQTGVTVSLLKAGSDLVGPRDFARMVSARDVLFLASPLAIFAAALWVPAPFQYPWRRIRLIGCASAVVLALLYLQPWTPRLGGELSANPLQYLARDVLKAPLQFYLGKANPYAGRVLWPGPSQMNSLALVDPLFCLDEKEALPPAAKAEKKPARPWNVLFFVLESVGSDYIFDNTLTNGVPMPFLQTLAGKSLFFANHHTTCNSSPNSGFSMFSGVYPRPTRNQFVMEENASVPLLNRYLGADYKSFLITPSSQTYSFPKPIFVNSGIRDIVSYETLPGEKEKGGLARDERTTVDYLLQTLGKTKQPFFGIYWSFVAHHPYPDYGSEYTILPDVTHNNRHRYYNNLRLLDTQIKKVVDYLESSGLLDHTVLVITGDHGEAFGQHAGVFTHSFGSYEETYRTPAIIYAPTLVKPQAIRRPTSHVDLAPTLLDLLGCSWRETSFQGESVFRPSRRKYIFMMDLPANYVSVLDNQMNKVSIGFEYGIVYAFNLARDPGEKFPLNEEAFAPHIDAILRYRNYQAQIIDRYSVVRVAANPP